MSSATEAEPEADEVLEFKWGKFKSRGVKGSEATFFHSFIFDGVEYFLYDCVYVYREGEPEPFVGKIIKMWTDKKKVNRVKLLWFFRPREIVHFYRNVNILNNELFLACGEGQGVANINLAEGIGGKCNVVCISKDARNPQLSEDEIELADFVFYRTFDVGLLTVSDIIGDKIAGTDVKCIFNRTVSQTSSGVAGNIDNLGTVVPNTVTGIKLDNISGNPIMLKSKIDAGKVEASAGELLSKGKPTEGEEKMNSSDDTETRPHKKAKIDSSIGNPVAKETNANFGKLISNPVEGREEVQSSADMETRPFKKPKVGSSDATPAPKDMNATQRPNIASGVVSLKDVSVSVHENRGKSNLYKEHLAIDGILSEKLNHGKQSEVSNGKLPDASSSLPQGDDRAKLKSDENISKRSNGKLVKAYNEDNSVKLNSGEKIPKLSNAKLCKASTIRSMEKDNIDITQEIEVTRRPDAERSRWFKELPWEEKMQSAFKQETLILLENLDPSYTSAQVEDIVWHGFTESCTAKRIQRTGVSNPHTGQALVIFKTKEAAEKAVRKLDQRILLLPNGRPLVGNFGVPSPTKKESTLVGHFSIDKPRLQLQRDMKEAVSTSHCSQPNTIEYEMAMEWCLLQDRSALAWRKLYKRQADEIRKAKAGLKSK